MTPAHNENQEVHVLPDGIGSVNLNHGGGQQTSYNPNTPNTYRDSSHIYYTSSVNNMPFLTHNANRHCGTNQALFNASPVYGTNQALLNTSPVYGTNQALNNTSPVYGTNQDLNDTSPVYGTTQTLNNISPVYGTTQRKMLRSFILLKTDE